jgi:hypothetical protein
MFFKTRLKLNILGPAKRNNRCSETHKNTYIVWAERRIYYS